VPECGCSDPELYLMGFELSPEMDAVWVQFRCANCEVVVRTKYTEAPDRLREHHN
jgi:hypothetical protein